ncbi:hypothetical protein PIB30_072994 [Stylosanthes scabra]|uniref:Uncharacterized protein n=1 Tax=Stylosanthes scabra TaxID=79078 RepID=A0ABU6YLU2_9FABA|nr:hypothetical protein [Stylosanthes scabra]
MVTGDDVATMVADSFCYCRRVLAKERRAWEDKEPEEGGKGGCGYSKKVMKEVKAISPVVADESEGWRHLDATSAIIDCVIGFHKHKKKRRNEAQK